MEPTSEQELKQLLDEGRITEEEFAELLEVIRQKAVFKQSAVEVGHPKPQMNDWKKGLLFGFMIAISSIVTALIITSIFKIQILRSLSISWLVVLPVLFAIRGFLLLRRK